MGSFSFFKNVRSPRKYITNKNGVELLSEGILFEDSDEFLKWGSFVRKLSDVLSTKIVSGDRTVYYWGKHTILNGLELDLATMFWRYRIGSLFKRFRNIEFSVVGDREAEYYLKLIRSHIQDQFGNPYKEGKEDNEVSLEWKINKVKIHLYFFEQHCYKLHLNISSN